MLIIDGARSVVIPRSDFHDRSACSIASHSCSNTSLAVVRPCIVFTQSNNYISSNSLLKNRELSIIIYVSALVQSHRIRTETFAFDTQLDLFSDNDFLQHSEEPYNKTWYQVAGCMKSIGGLGVWDPCPMLSWACLDGTHARTRTHKHKHNQIRSN